MYQPEKEKKKTSDNNVVHIKLRLQRVLCSIGDEKHKLRVEVDKNVHLSSIRKPYIPQQLYRDGGNVSSNVSCAVEKV
jgi:hypothetical protein